MGRHFKGPGAGLKKKKKKKTSIIREGFLEEER